MTTLNSGPISAGLRAALRDKKRRGAAYLQLFSYLAFMAIYMFVVYVQSDVVGLCASLFQFDP